MLKKTGTEYIPRVKQDLTGLTKKEPWGFSLKKTLHFSALRLQD